MVSGLRLTSSHVVHTAFVISPISAYDSHAVGTGTPKLIGHNDLSDYVKQAMVQFC